MLRVCFEESGLSGPEKERAVVGAGQRGKTWIGMEEATIDSEMMDSEMIDLETIDLEADNEFCRERGWTRVSDEHLFRAHLASVVHSVAVTILNLTDEIIWPTVL